MTVSQVLPSDSDVAPDITDITRSEMSKSLGLVLTVAHHVSFARLHKIMHSAPLKIGEYTVLRGLMENPGARQGVLADVYQIKWPSMTKLVHSLEKRGLIQRFVPADDRRSIALMITDAGRESVMAYTPLLDEADKAVYADLDAQEHATLLRLLRKFVGWGDPGQPVEPAPET